MPTNLHVAVAAMTVTGCLVIGYGLYLASRAITLLADLTAVSGMPGLM